METRANRRREKKKGSSSVEEEEERGFNADSRGTGRTAKLFSLAWVLLIPYPYVHYTMTADGTVVSVGFAWWFVFLVS